MKETKQMSNVYIITKEGKEYNPEGIAHIMTRIRKDHNDESEINIMQGQIINNPNVLADFLNDDPKNSYIFVSHNKGIDLIHTNDDIHATIDLLKDKKATSWSILMHAIGNI